MRNAKRVMLAATFIAVTCAGCARKPDVRTAAAPTTTALTSCEAVRQIPPTLKGAARTDGSDQPILVVGCALH